MIKAKTIIFYVLLFSLTISCTVEGEIGPKGPIGNQGEIGSQGEKGNPGVPGIQGVSGPPGQLGKTGPQGQDAPQPQATIITINNTVFTIQEEIEILIKNTEVKIRKRYTIEYPKSLIESFLIFCDLLSLKSL